MKLRFKLSILICFVLAIVSCKKENCFPNFDISGQITDVITGLPVPGASVILYRHDKNALDINNYSMPEEIRSFVSDEEGSYSFKIRQNKNRKYSIGVEKEGYKTKEEKFTEGVTQVNNYALIPEGYISLTFVDNPNLNYDRVELVGLLLEGDSIDLQWCDITFPRQISKIVDGNSTLNVNWTLYENAGCGTGFPAPSNLNFSQEFWVPFADTVYLQIEM